MKKLALGLASAGVFTALTVGLATPAVAAAGDVTPSVYSTQTDSTTYQPVNCSVDVNHRRDQRQCEVVLNERRSAQIVTVIKRGFNNQHGRGVVATCSAWPGFPLGGAGNEDARRTLAREVGEDVDAWYQIANITAPAGGAAARR